MHQEEKFEVGDCPLEQGSERQKNTLEKNDLNEFC